MDKRILVLTDFSKNALNASKYALELYSEHKCTFYFLNTFREVGYRINSHIHNYAGELSYDIKAPNTIEGFKNLMHTLDLQAKSPNHSYHTISSHSSLLEGVNDTIAKHDIDIVVMGTKGSTSSRTVVFVMNSINIMENITTCPVLAIPEDVDFMPPKQIAFPTDFKTPFKRRELTYLINIAQMHSANIQVLHVKESETLNLLQLGNKKLLETLFKDVEHTFHELEKTSVHDGINNFIDTHDSDMVAFINQKRNFFNRLISKPLTNVLGYQTPVPVLVLKNRI